MVKILKCSFGNSAGCLSGFVGFKYYLVGLKCWTSLEGSSYPFVQSSLITYTCLSVIAINLCPRSRVCRASKLLLLSEAGSGLELFLCHSGEPLVSQRACPPPALSAQHRRESWCSACFAAVLCLCFYSSSGGYEVKRRFFKVRLSEMERIFILFYSQNDIGSI